MFQTLQAINTRPAPFACYTAAELWTDEHTSSKMLEYHLNGSVDISSRRIAFIDQSVEWIISRFGLGTKRSVADFGCGPGLYTTRLANSGADVTGIDFSRRSIQYARTVSDRQGLKVTHIHADYLEYETSSRFDLITMIMCDFCALSPEHRHIMLDKYFRFLKPGGAVLFDVFSLNAFEKREETTTYAPELLDGFWSSEPYYGFLNTFKYEPDMVVLDKYSIVQEKQTREVFNWLQYYDAATLRTEIESHGFVIETFLGNVAGAVFNTKADEFAVIARKPDVA